MFYLIFLQFELFINIPGWIFGCWRVLRLITEGCILNQCARYIIAVLLVSYLLILETCWLLILICAPQVWDMAKLGQQAGSCKSK